MMSSTSKEDDENSSLIRFDSIFDRLMYYKNSSIRDFFSERKNILEIRQKYALYSGI